MSTSFLDYYKMILDKVSFDPGLFSKEYQKAIHTLRENEAVDLNHWLKVNGFQYILANPAHSTRPDLRYELHHLE
jgi:hypothetical protein